MADDFEQDLEGADAPEAKGAPGREGLANEIGKA
jgi:hypothetical protein